MHATAGRIRLETDRRALLFLLAAPILGVLITGYRYGASDQALYIPMIERALDPSLFPNDYLFAQPSGEYSLWFPAVTWAARFVPLEWLFFVGHLLTRVGLLWAIYHVSLNLFERRGTALLAVLLLLVPHPVGGTATATHDTFFTLRSTAMPFAIGFLIPYFRGASISAAALCAITFLIHPITAVPLIGLLICRLAIDGRRHGWRAPGRALGLFAVLIAPLVLRVWLGAPDDAGAEGAGLLSRPDPGWLEIMRTRNSYVFPSAWGPEDIAGVLLYLAALVGVLLARRHGRRTPTDPGERDRWAVLAIAVCAGLALIGTAFVEWYPVSIVLQLQVLRSIYLIINLSMLYLAWWVWTRLRVRGAAPVRTAALGALLLAGLAPLIGARAEHLTDAAWLGERRSARLGDAPGLGERLARHIDLPGRVVTDDWAEVGRWARAHTPIDATFLVPPRTQGFRIHSRRGIVGDWKDGAAAVFSERYAEIWWARMQALDGYGSFDTRRFKELATRYRADFAVARKDAGLDLPVLYENEGFVVYALDGAP